MNPLTIDCNTTRDSILFQFVGFVRVNNLKQTLNRRIFTVHRTKLPLSGWSEAEKIWGEGKVSYRPIHF